MLDFLWLRLLKAIDRIARDERGEVVEWLALTIGLALTATAMITVLRPILESAVQSIGSFFSSTT